MKIATALAVALLLGFTFAEQNMSSENSNAGLPPGITVTINDPTAGIELEVAEELYLTPTSIRGEIPAGGTTGYLNVTVASRIPTEVEVRTSNSDLLVVGDSNVRMGAGSRVGVLFTAFSAHSGTIDFLNTEGVVVATVPYSVTRESPYRQNVSATVNSDGNVNASYSIRFQEGFGISTSFGYGADGDFSGSLTGSYSW